MEQVKGWLALFSIAGLGGFIWAVAKSIDLWRKGSNKTEANAIRQLERWAMREQKKAERLELLLDYWRNRAAQLEYIIITTQGIEALPPRQVLPLDPERSVAPNGYGDNEEEKQ